MATIVLSAVGASLGAAVGGSVLGLSSIVIGRAIGATFGRVIDQRLMGQGSDAVTTGRIDRFRLTGATEGAVVPKVFGRMRVGGQTIWATRFKESVVTSGGSGKGVSSKPTTRTYSYSVSLALALGVGVVSRIGRVWADGVEISKDDLNMRFYPGDELQLADPKIAAVEGAENAPAFRGTAYVVLEDLGLNAFGNRVPQFNFEIFRAAQSDQTGDDLSSTISGVALMPGTGEYALATTAVHFSDGAGVNRSANVNTASGKSDLATSLENLREELPAVGSVSLVASWFGDDLRCGQCQLQPAVEQNASDGVGMPWAVSDQLRGTAKQVSHLDGRPVFGGTPTDASVIEAITEINAGGQDVMFYPFILMDIQDGNGLSDPWSGAVDQAVMPWRGRITLSAAPGQSGTPDQTAGADSEVAAFFGTAAVGDFIQTAQGVDYSGPLEWSYRRFILHYAHLCAAAGGVAAFCIGSEMRSLTHIRGSGGGFPAVDALITLAADVRAILGPDVKIGYAADWSEYFGYHPQDGSGDVLFHLDALWADANIDFIGIDNYMPLSDWRDGQDHLDAEFGAIYAPDYLAGNVAGGEGFDWYYPSVQARDAQLRSSIQDGSYGEDWIFRYKDLKNWWASDHHNRPGGVRQAAATAWVPESKPIWFTELGCPAVDKGTNQPNVFLDPKSSESALPYYSSGGRDDFIQAQYLRAIFNHWEEGNNNPISSVYAAQMVDMTKAHVWAWDARPWPAFPNNLALWSDGDNYSRGHWISGRTFGQSLGAVVAEICFRGGVIDYDVSKLFGSVTGYFVNDIQSGRAALQPLMLAFGFEALERDGVLWFQNRDGKAVEDIALERLVWQNVGDDTVQSVRTPEAETAGKVRLEFIKAGEDYQTGAVEAIFPDEMALGVTGSEMPLALRTGEAQVAVERWLAESRIARDTVSFSVPQSQLALGAGDVIRLPDSQGNSHFRIDRVEDVGFRQIEAVRVEPSVYDTKAKPDDTAPPSEFVPPVPVYPLFMDLPLLTGAEVEHAPHIAVTATPWPGSVALYSSPTDAGYELNRLIGASSVIGVTETNLQAAAPARWNNGPGVRVRIFGGALSSGSAEDVLNGANVAAIGDGSGANWEVLQFQNADLVGTDTYVLSGLLRGQLGSDALMPDDWPVGSQFVLLNGVSEQIELAVTARDLARHYRVGPALRSYDDPSYVHEIHSFSGVGLRPYAPAHLRAANDSAGDLDISWIRRTRIDGDNWSLGDVPLGEAFEAYRLRILDGSAIVRTVDVGVNNWIYTAAQQVSDGVPSSFDIEVAQISERFGPGLYTRITVNG